MTTIEQLGGLDVLVSNAVGHLDKDLVKEWANCIEGLD